MRCVFLLSCQQYNPGLHFSKVLAPGESKFVILTNLTAFTFYSVTVTAFTGPLEHAVRDGKSSEPVLIRTKEESTCPFRCFCRNNNRSPGYGLSKNM